MPINRWILAGLWLSLLPVLFGCNPDAGRVGGNASAGGVAVIDLDQVASELGYDQSINQAIQAAEQQAQQRLEQLQNDLHQRVTEQAQQLGDNPSPQQQETFETFRYGIDQEFRTAIAQAQQHIDRVRTTMIGEFRQQVRPLARQAAADRGLAVVVVVHEGVLDYQPGVDITTEVIRSLRSSGQSLTLPPTPPAPPNSSSPSTTSPLPAVPGGPGGESGTWD